LTRFRLLFAISALVALATALVACGGGGGGGGGEDPNKVIDQTFSSDHESVKSGNLNLSLDVDIQGKQGGKLTASLSGPFESQGKAKVPKLDFNVKADLSGTDRDFNFDGGLTSTGDAAYVNYKGSDYQVTPALFDQYQQLLQQVGAQQPGSQQNSAQELLNRLGIKDPKDLLTNLKNDGEADVEGTTTNHISGDLDVGRAIEGVQNLLRAQAALGALGGSSSQLPDPAQLDEVKKAIKTAHFDLYSGQDDHILRRLTIHFVIEPTSGTTDKVDLTFDASIGGVNESQTVEAPSNSKPFAQLLKQLGVSPSQLGGLGALGLGAGNPSVGGGGSTTVTPPSGGAGAQQAQKYLQCLGQAKSAADIQACEALTK
jgi:hypothetical protein